MSPIPRVYTAGWAYGVVPEPQRTPVAPVEADRGVDSDFPQPCRNKARVMTEAGLIHLLCTETGEHVVHYDEIFGMEWREQ